MKKTFLTITLLVTLLLSQTPKPQKTTSSFFDLYDQNRKEQVSNYISLDFILSANYLFKQQSVGLEERVLYPKFKRLAVNLRANLLKDYKPQKAEALAYLFVLNELLGNQNSSNHTEALALAKKELKLINSHRGILPSPIAKVKLDYSQLEVNISKTLNSNPTFWL